MSKTVMVVRRLKNAGLVEALSGMSAHATSRATEEFMLEVRDEQIAENEEVLKIEIEAVLVGHERRLTIYNVTVSNADGTWNEVFGSKVALSNFLTGVRTAVTMFGLHMPEVNTPQV